MFNIHNKYKTKLKTNFSRLLTLLLVFHFFILNIPTYAKGEIEANYAAMPCQAESVIVYDISTGEILYSRNVHELRYPASITKMLTGLLAVEYGDLNDTITFNSDAVNLESGSSNLEFKDGEEISLKNALYGLMLKSANEIANQLGYYVEEKSNMKFTEAADKKLKEIGAFETVFTNPSGLHKDTHHTTCYDMALIANAAYNNETFKKIYTTKNYTIPKTNKTNETRSIYNTHKMLYPTSPYYVDTVIGGKTGFTDEAGNTLITFSEGENLKLIVVVMKGCGTPVTYGDTKNLLNYFSASYVTKNILNKNDIIATCPYVDKKGNVIKNVKLALSEDLKVTIPWNFEDSAFTSLKKDDTSTNDVENTEILDGNTDNNILKDKSIEEIKLSDLINYENDLFKIEKNIPEKLKKPVSKGDIVGNITITYNNKKSQSISIIASETSYDNTNQIDLTFLYYGLFGIFFIMLVCCFIKFIKLSKEEKQAISKTKLLFK